MSVLSYQLGPSDSEGNYNDDNDDDDDNYYDYKNDNDDFLDLLCDRIK